MNVKTGMENGAYLHINRPKKPASNRIILKVTKNYLQYTKNAEKLRSIYGFK